MTLFQRDRPPLTPELAAGLNASFGVLGGWCVGAAWALAWWGAAIAWERVTRRRLNAEGG